MSLSWPTSSLAATRGATFLPLAVAGKKMWLYAEATASTCAATFSARPSASAGAVGVQHLGDARDGGGGGGDGAGVGAGHQHVDVAADLTAAVMVLSVEPLRVALSCSAMTRVVM